MKTPDRAMRDLTDANDVRRALDTRRVMHDRDEEASSRASARYEELRLLDMPGLVNHARAIGLPCDSSLPRAVLITDILEKEESQ